MALIVQKFGGTSVADPQMILAAARKAIRAQQQGNQVVMVVSAMGKNTDMLVDLADQINERPPAREMDMLLATGEQVSVALMAMAIHALGHKAISLTGAQIGIKTDSTHTKARIKTISTERVKQLLDDNQIVIAAGFQGIDENFNITTLGRGGSDTTAVALSAVLDADACEIYTDVDGVYTTDPRVVPEARRVDRISYDEMLELASLGAGVMHSRSIEFAKKYSVPIHVRSSLSDTRGTMIVNEPEHPDQPVCGAALTRDEARVSVLGVPDVPGTSLDIFSRIAKRKITVDMIVQNVGENGRSDISFTVPRDELNMTLQAVRESADTLHANDVTHDKDVAKVSVVGMAMERQAGVAEKTFRALATAGINIQMITTSEIKISALVSKDDALPALRAVHSAFQLDEAPDQRESVESVEPTESHRKAADAADVADHLRDIAMEELVVNTISLDCNQARVTIGGVPDTPGVAAQVFEQVARGGILVDMIVQSYNGAEGIATLSFTVPRVRLDATLEVARRLSKEFSCQGVSSSPEIAKLSVSGIGMRSHTSVAIRVFAALANADINVEMVNTSEMQVNVVVDGSRAETALALLHEAFADVLV